MIDAGRLKTGPKWVGDRGRFIIRHRSAPEGQLCHGNFLGACKWSILEASLEIDAQQICCACSRS